MKTTIQTFIESKNKFRKKYDGLRHRVSPNYIDPETKEPFESKTIQSGKNEANINNIIKKYDKRQLVADAQAAIKNYGDFTTINEYQESQNIIAQATQSFAALPSEIRQRFGNNPGEFFEFATNPANNAELIKLGLATKVEEIQEIIQKVEITNPPIEVEKPQTS